MARVLVSVSVAWGVHYHGSTNPCCQLAIQVLYTDSLVLARDGTHNFIFERAVSFQSSTAVATVNLSTQSAEISAMNTAIASLIPGVGLVAILSVTSITKTADYA